MREENKKIFQYVAPSVASLLVTFLYIAIDCMFVGQGVGADALAAVNLALPYAALITSLANLVAMGGASIAAIRLGRGDEGGASSAASVGLMLALAASVVVCGAGMVFPEAIAAASGAGGRLLAPTAEYTFYYSEFVIFFVLSICLSAFVRNDGRPGLAFWGMIAGAAANIFLDWLFIFPFGMGIKGAAIASGIGQILSVAILLTHFIGRKGRLRLRPILPTATLIGKIFLRGVPEFVTQISQPVTILCFNYVVMRELGETGVAAFAVICNLGSLMFAVLSGAACGMQPLFGGSFGEKDWPRVRYFLKAGMVLNVVSAFVIYLILVGSGKTLVSLFNGDPELIRTAVHGMSMYAFAFVLAAVNIMATAFFLSTKRTGRAMVIAVARGCCLNVVAIFLLPALFGGEVVWLTIGVSEAVTILISLVLLKTTRNDQRNPDSVVLLRQSRRGAAV